MKTFLNGVQVNPKTVGQIFELLPKHSDYCPGDVLWCPRDETMQQAIVQNYAVHSVGAARYNPHVRILRPISFSVPQPQPPTH